MKKNFLILIVLVICCTISASNADTLPEYKVKAAYLYNFAKFIKWPGNTFKNASSPIIIGVFGDIDFSRRLTPLLNRKVRNRPIEIKFFDSITDAQNCQLLYIKTDKPEELTMIIDELKTCPTVTIGDIKDFAASGGIIQFATVRERLRFIINHEIAKRNNIQIDAQLLSLAIDVLEEKQ